MEDRIPNSKSGLYLILSDIHCPVVINFDTSVTIEPVSYLWGTLKYNDTNKIVKFVPYILIITNSTVYNIQI
jgi:hypothetical protein